MWMPPRNISRRTDRRTDWQPTNVTDSPKSLVGVQSGLCLYVIVITNCGKIETIIDSLKITGAKGDLCPGSFMSTGESPGCPGGVGGYAKFLRVGPPASKSDSTTNTNKLFSISTASLPFLNLSFEYRYFRFVCSFNLLYIGIFHLCAWNLNYWTLALSELNI